jgi:hypothetical protein
MSLRLKITFSKVRSILFRRHVQTHGLSIREEPEAHSQSAADFIDRENEFSADLSKRSMPLKLETNIGDADAAISNKTD